MNRSTLNVVILFCTLLAASTMLPAHAENAPQPSADTPTALDRQQLLNELAELEAQVERIRRTRGEAGLRRLGLRQKLADKKEMAEFHLKLIDRLERSEQRLNALEARTTSR